MDPYGKACVDYLNGERDISIQFSSEIAELLFCAPQQRLENACLLINRLRF